MSKVQTTENTCSRTFHTTNITASNKTVLKISLQDKCFSLISKKKKSRIAICDAATYATCCNMQHKAYAKENDAIIIAQNFLGNDVMYTPQSIITQRYHKGIKMVKKHLIKKQMNTGRPDPTEDFPRLNRHGVCVSVSKVLEDDLMGIPYHLQGDDTNFAYLEGVRCFQRAVAPCAQGITKTSITTEWLFDQIEKLLALHHWWKKCDTSADLVHWISLAYRVFTNRNATSDALKYLATTYNDLQGDALDDFVGVLRKGFDRCENVYNSEMSERATKLYTFLLVQGFLTKFGIELSNAGYSKLETKAMQIKHNSKSGMWFCVFETTIFVLERICAYRKTGEVSSFLHSGGEYTAWLDMADKLLALAPFTSNLAAHNTTYFKFVADLNHCIEQGDAYARFTNKNSGADSLTMRKKLQSLHLLKNTEITKRASQQERRAPFGVLVHGGSSVGKSTFTKMLYYYYGKIHSLDTDDHFRYVRSPSDEYWSNFDTSMWCIQMDDIAYLLPKKSTGVDPTLSELLNVVNNVPHVPPQADLADKGKTPIRAKLVIATSNAPTLNAEEYFWCPLATQRRLPFVVKVEPKDCYKHPNGRFLDPSKLPPIAGAFPDYWHITLQKVKPVIQDSRERAKLEEVGVYDDIHEFLKAFGEASREHELVQDKSMTCDVAMKGLTVCPMCLYGTERCECEQQGHCETVCDWMRKCFWSFFVAFFQIKIVFNTSLTLAKYEAFRRVYVNNVLNFLPSRVQIMQLGEINRLQASDRRFVQALAILAGVAGLGLIIHSLSGRQEVLKTPHGRNENEEVADESQTEEQEEHEEEYFPQGNIHGTTENQLLKEERQNVWYSQDLSLSKFDMPLASKSLVGVSSDQLRDMFGRNCVRIHITGIDEAWTMKIGAVFVRGHFCVINNHAFAKGSKWRVTIIQGSTAPGISPNIDIVMDERDLKRNAEMDLCVFEVRSVPPFKDITKFWTTKNIQATAGVVLRRDTEGMCEKQQVHGLNLVEKMWVEPLQQNIDMYIGVGDRLSRKGDCGALLLSNTPQGVSVLGIHTLGSEKRCGYTAIPLASIEELIVTFDRVEVQGGGAPNFDTPTVTRTLESAHWRSLFRYIPEGTANVYGTFTGFRPKPKSRVCETPLSAVMCDHFDYSVKYGPPAMAGWEPWRKNVIEMVKPQVNYDKTLLRECVDSYTNDIIGDLPKGWEAQLVFLSPKAAINGLPGVVFVDGINRKTSMGFPWNKSKRGFLQDDICETYPDGVKFDDEVNERVETILGKYREGRRAYPVYSGHLKDEPRPFSKVESKSTRLFTASPVDESLVIRSRLLSFVRLLQLNKFAFEAAPGTVCQSTEWGEFHTYLTQHGAHKIVGGDYGKYDKRMTSDFVLAAFDVICKIHERAGFSKEEIREIMCIGNDVAFPVVNVNGDLVEFFGTNPSGHPLTVVINSLVNSLYMRYCFYKMRPEGSSDTFKENVALITYGDDNGMGVNDRVPWFNHTTIQQTLAEIGVEYTMADKVTASIPYIHIDQFSFLKRRWVYDEKVGAWLCPLEEESIHKSLTTWTPSESIDKHAQMVAVISSANTEYFFYGREVFQKQHDFFAGILAQEPYSAYVVDKTLPNWESLYMRFWRGSKELSPSD